MLAKAKRSSNNEHLLYCLHAKLPPHADVKHPPDLLLLGLPHIHDLVLPLASAFSAPTLGIGIVLGRLVSVCFPAARMPTHKLDGSLSVEILAAWGTGLHGLQHGVTPLRGGIGHFTADYTG